MIDMKSPLEAPEKQIAEETTAKVEKPTPSSVIDTSKMSKGKREALELAEASRDPLDERGSFAAIFLSGVTISTGFFPGRSRAPRIARPARNFSRIWKSICAKTWTPTRWI